MVSTHSCIALMRPVGPAESWELAKGRSHLQRGDPQRQRRALESDFDSISVTAKPGRVAITAPTD
jgi:hypothetical protein